jgi:membrane-associated protease RseP (regulator of RpoE activity)
MKKLMLLATILMLAASPVLAEEDKDVERGSKKEERRVTISVTQSVDGDGEQFVWVQRDGEEPILQALPLGKPRGYLGVNLTEMTPELREALGAPAEMGVLINRVVPDSPAARAGLQAGDVLTRIEGTDIDSSATVQAEIFSREKDDVVTIEVYRERKLQQLSATLDQIERPRLNIAEFFPRIRKDGEGKTEFRFVGPGAEFVPLDRLQNLERLELRTLPFDEERLQRIIEGIEASGRFPAGELTPEELERQKALRKKLEERLREIEKKLEEMEKRMEKR